MHRIIAFLGTFALAAITSAQPYDNPEYAAWARFKPGSMVRSQRVQVTYKIKSEQSGDTWVTREVPGTRKETRHEIVKTLLEITAEQAVVEVKQSPIIAGKSVEAPGEKKVLPAKLTDDPGERKHVRDEEITVGHRKLKCKVLTWGEVLPRTTLTMTTWTSNAVPGGEVKSTVAVENFGSERTAVVEEVTEYVAKHTAP